MAEKTIIVCDNCSREIEDKKNIYRVVLKSMEQWHDVYDHDYNYIAIELCSTCSKRLIPSLEAIVTKFGLK